MPLKSEHFITPIKLVLPGIIVSVIGLFASNYIFNNPHKNKAKATYATWSVLKQFERIFMVNSDLIPCRSDTVDQIQFKKDYIHLIEMTKQNITDLKNEDNIDKRLDAVINLKIDSYSELKRISELYLDTFSMLREETNKYNYSKEQVAASTSYYQGMFSFEIDHIISRDTAIITGILNDLTKNYGSYVDSFKIDELLQPASEIRSFMIGKWLTIDKVLIDIRQDGKGVWTENGVGIDFTWKYETSLLNMLTKTKETENSVKITIQLAGQPFPKRLEIVKANKDVIGFTFLYKNSVVYAQACRK